MNIQNMIRLHPNIDVYLQFLEGEFKLYSKYQSKVLYSFKPTKVQITNVQSYQLYQGNLYVHACDLYVLQDFDLELVVKLPPNSQFFTFCKQMYVISYKTVYQILDNKLVHVMDFEHNTEVFQFGTFVFFKQNEIFYSCQMKNNKFALNYGHGIKVEGGLVFHGSGLCLFKKDQVYNCFNLISGTVNRQYSKNFINEIIYVVGYCGTQIRNDQANKLFGFQYALDVQNIFNSHFEANSSPDFMRQLLKMFNKCEFRIKDQEMIDWETENLRENTVPFQNLKYCFKIQNQNRSLVFVDQDLYVIDENRNILKRIFLNINIQQYGKQYKPIMFSGKIYIQNGNQLLVLEQDKLVFICEMPSKKLGLFTHYNNLYYLNSAVGNNKIYMLSNNKFKKYIQPFYSYIMQLPNQIRIQTSREILSVTENFSETKIILKLTTEYLFDYTLYNQLLVYYDQKYCQNVQIVDLLTNTNQTYKTNEFIQQNIKYQKEFNNFGVRLKQQLCAKYNIKQEEDMQAVTNCNDICNSSVTQLDVETNAKNILYSKPQSTIQYYQYINVLPAIQPNLYAVVEDGFLHYADFNNTVLHRIPIDFSGCFMNATNKQFDTQNINNKYINNVSQQQIVISNGNIYIFNYEKLYQLQFSGNKLIVQFVTNIPLKEHYNNLKYYYFSFEDSLYVILKNDIYVLKDYKFILQQTLDVPLDYNYQAVQFCNNVYFICCSRIYKLERGTNKKLQLKELHNEQYPLTIMTVCGGLAIFEVSYNKLILNMITSEIIELGWNAVEHLRKNDSFEIKSMGLQLKSQVLTQQIKKEFESQANQHYQQYLNNIKHKYFRFGLLLYELYCQYYNFDKTNQQYNRIESKIHTQQQTIMLALNSVLERQAYYIQIFDQICFCYESQ
ncbi:Conserved_hypothetical protein [Hexamita inflata]|uniref:Uncharacterized protein n=1 Tax=Hexamita inflata TaxID=28002 RepID=A0AA86NXP4_9EUKA|nr:Conserved hypothetical protein [Hexamita inflata]